MDSINKTTSDIWRQYDEALNTRSKQITVATTGAFLKALKFQDDKDPNKVRWQKNGILVRDRDTGKPLHVLPNQLFKGDINCYFPKNSYNENKTQREIDSSFPGVYTHKNARLANKKTKASHHNEHGIQFPTYKGSEDEDGDISSTGELEGVFEGRPALLSQFATAN